MIAVGFIALGAVLVVLVYPVSLWRTQDAILTVVAAVVGGSAAPLVFRLAERREGMKSAPLSRTALVGAGASALLLAGPPLLAGLTVSALASFMAGLFVVFGVRIRFQGR